MSNWTEDISNMYHKRSVHLKSWIWATNLEVSNERAVRGIILSSYQKVSHLSA